jgi:hypothetical protein
MAINVSFKTKNDLTVTGNISASNLFYDISGNSSQWNTAYQSVSSQPYTLVNATSSINTIRGSNTSSGKWSAVLGGTNNRALSSYNFIGNGINNTIIDSCNTILNAYNSSISATCTYSGTYQLISYGTPPNILNNNIIAGGCCNIIKACAAASDYYDNNVCTTSPIIGCSVVCSNTILNGYKNNISQQPQIYTPNYSGRSNATNSGYIKIENNFIGTGCSNNIAGNYSSIVNGFSGCIISDYSFIGSGCKNYVTNNYNFIGTGKNNTASGGYSVVLGGYNNDTNNKANVFILGNSIKASCDYTTYVNNLSAGSGVGTGNISGTSICAKNLTTDNFTCKGSNIPNITQFYKHCGVIGGHGSQTSILPYLNSFTDNSTISSGYNSILNGNVNYTANGSLGCTAYNTVINGSSNTILATSVITSVGNGGTASSYPTSIISYSNISGYSNSILGTGSGYYNNNSCSYTAGRTYINNSIINGRYNCITNKNLSNTFNTDTYSSYNTILNGSSNCIQSCYGNSSTCSNFSSIINGCNNKICGNYNTILNGKNNALSGTNNFILGSNISVSANNYTFVNNISSQGVVASPIAQFGSTASIAKLNSAPLTVISSASGSVFNQIQNITPSVSSSTDISLYNDDSINYLDLGIASTKYNGNLYSPTFNVVNAGDSYVYATSANLVLGAASTTSNLTFFTGGTLNANERMRINSSGNVGIGTSTPNTNLTVSGSISATGTLFANNINLGSSLISNNSIGVAGNIAASKGFFTNNSYTNTFTTGLVVDYTSGLGRISVGNESLSFYNKGIGNTSTVFISANGNVGIGTSTPNTNLTVSGSISATNTIYTSALNITSAPTTFTNPVTASGSFLIVNINGTNKAIQLWDYTI